jgi:CheY-like chemotaxis protein
MILLDVDMPEMSGYEVIRLLKANPLTAGIPVIFLTAKDDEESEIEGFGGHRLYHQALFRAPAPQAAGGSFACGGAKGGVD